MVDIRPFKGFYCNDELNPCNEFITPPYDKISPTYAHELYKREFNNVHLILGQQHEHDGDSDNRYTRAKDLLDKWISEGKLLQSEQERLYIYKQQFRYKTPKTFSRYGLICLLKLETFESGLVRPHEFTLSKPKEDRMKLMQATNANLGQLFMLYRDEEQKAKEIFNKYESTQPLIDAADENDDKHTIWEISDKEDINVLTKLFSDKSILIADGHHRYETALAYMDEQRQGVEESKTELPSDFTMVTLVNMYEEDLLILPTYRLVRDVSISFDDLVSKMSAKFNVQADFLVDEDNFESQARAFLSDSLGGSHRFICVGEHGRRAVFFTLKENVDPMLEIKKDLSPQWKQLEVAVLHEMILKKYLGISEEDIKAGTHLGYRREVHSAIDALRKGNYQYLFMMNPADAKQVFAVADSGCRMPQKSTDFYPKLYSGLILRKM